MSDTKKGEDDLALFVCHVGNHPFLARGAKRAQNGQNVRHRDSFVSVDVVVT